MRGYEERLAPAVSLEEQLMGESENEREIETVDDTVVNRSRKASSCLTYQLKL